eukprot:Skav226770  [mRNA]  locus=scaffold8:181316:185906:- [translate_table: standard]
MKSEHRRFPWPAGEGPRGSAPEAPEDCHEAEVGTSSFARAGLATLMAERRREREGLLGHVWAHSCVSKKKLEAALQVTAIEVDVAMGYYAGFADTDGRPSIVVFPAEEADFLDELIRDGRRHVKFDFKDLEAVRLCLPMLAERSGELASNGQAVWLNADVLPGPGLRSWSCSVPAEDFLTKAEELCPGAHLSLGWKANPVTSDAYNEVPTKKLHAKQNVVFAVSARTAAKNFEPLAALLAQALWEPSNAS